MMIDFLREKLERVHAKAKQLAIQINDKFVVPLILVVVYFLGLGLTKILGLFVTHPLLNTKDTSTTWREIKMGFDPDAPEHTPNENRYLRQS